MKKCIACILLVVFSITILGAADYEPYRIDEFPEWSVKLRRAETLMFGSLPITIGVTGLAYSTAQLLGAAKFSQDPFVDTMTVIGIAGGLSLVIAVADYIIGEMQE